MSEVPETSERQVRWGLGDACIGFFGAVVLAAILTPIILKATGHPADANTDNLPLGTIALIQIPYSVTPAAVALWASYHKGRGAIIDFGLRIRAGDIPLGALLGVAAQLAATVLYIPILWFTSYDSNDVSGPAKNLTDKATGGGVLLLILIVVILAPICEEIFWRGLVLRSVERRWGTTWAIIGSSLVFGAAHIEPLQFPALVLFGVVAALLTVRTGRLGPSICAHIAFNAFTVLALLA
jgi:membrane protease YdiL (CAAX protease family)